MKILKLCALLASLALVTSQFASAHEKKYIFDISGVNELPANGSAGTGFATVTFDLDLVTMHVEAEFSGLTGLTSAAHIHCCDFLPSGAAGVATTTPTFTGFPLNVTSGVYDHTFDMTLASSYRPAFVTASGGTISGALNALLGGLDSGKAYFNIHTSAFPAGEIRGLAVPVPEPTTALMGLVALGLPMFRRRRSAKSQAK